MTIPGTKVLARRWLGYRREPFPLLVDLFVQRIFQGSNRGEDQLNLSMGLVLALLAIPGGFISIFLFNKYGSFLQWLRGETNFDPLAAALPDEYFFITLSMMVTGTVAVWWWDNIFPDRRDFMNLVPLPISIWQIFRANACALALLATVFACDVNAASCVLFPLVVSWSAPTYAYWVQFAVIHALVVVLASLFSFLAVFAAVGGLMVIVPYAFFRRISAYVRILIVIALLALLSTSGVIPGMFVERPSSWILPLLPSAWFLGLCQWLRGRADPLVAGLGQRAVTALVAAWLISAIAYAVAYRQVFSRILERAEAPPGKLGMHTRAIFWLLDNAILGTPFERAGYRFASKTLWRNETHALALGGFLGLGLVIASHALFTVFNGQALGSVPSPELLSIPLVLSYCLLLGLRLLFDLPTDIRANWIFRFLLGNSTPAAIPLARRVMLTLIQPWLVLLFFPAYLAVWGWKVAVFHTVITLSWSALLVEILLARFRKLPFTCAYPAFQHSAVVNVMGYVLGFFAFAPVTAEWERAVLETPAMVLTFVPLVGGACYFLERFRHDANEIDRQIIFEDRPGSGFELLHLANEDERWSRSL